jgi:LAO/AO transport system kinase
VTKYDQSLKQEAQRVKREYLSASKYIRRKNKFWQPRVILTSSKEEVGIDELWNLLMKYQEVMLEHGKFFETREKQLKLWFYRHLKENLFDVLFADVEMKQRLERLEKQVVSGELTPGQASDMLINRSNILIQKN